MADCVSVLVGSLLVTETANDPRRRQSEEKLQKREKVKELR